MLLKSGRLLLTCNTSFTYNEYAEQVTVTDNDSKVTKTDYDDRGLVDFQTQDFGGLGYVTSFVYDIYGRVIETTDPEGKKVATTYNKFDQVLTTTDDVDNLAVVTTNTYDPLTLQLKTIKDHKLNVTSYLYDNYQRLTTETYADNLSKVYTYNDYSQRETITDQRGNETTFVYDDFGRLKTTDIIRGQDVNGVDQMNYTYDTDFRLKTAESLGGKVYSKITRNYDNFSRLTSEDQTIGTVTKTVSKTFDNVGRLDTVSYPSGRNLTYNYDNTHQVTKIFDANTDYVSYTYNNRNLVDTKTLGNGLVLTKNYDAVYRTTTQEWKKFGTTVAGFDYKYDKVGNRKIEVALHNTAKSAVYNYDTTYKVTGYKQGLLVADDVPNALFYQDWTQDALGNWDSFNNNSVVLARAHDEMNQITSVGATGFTHDLSGNMTSDGVNLYEFDALNRLVKATVGGVVTSYTYDAFNRRVQKDVNGVVTNFVCDGNRVVEEQDALGVLVKDYVYGMMFIDEVIAMGVGINDYYYLSDYRHSVIALSDASANIVERYEYTTFGERTITDDAYTVISSSAFSIDYGFTGRRHDTETGVMYFRARYYSGLLGRFLSRDPLGFIDGMGLHRGYFGVNFVDPSGKAIVFRRRAGGGEGVNVLDHTGTVQLPSGATGTVRVFSNVRWEKFDTTANSWLKRGSGSIHLELTGATGCDSCRWLQFVYRTREDANGNEVNGTYSTGSSYYRYGIGGRHVDSGHPSIPFYDETGRMTRSARISLIQDRPNVDLSNGINVVKAIFDSFLICTFTRVKRIIYSVHWERVGRRVDGRNVRTYENISGSATNGFPLWARGNTLNDGFNRRAKGPDGISGTADDILTNSNGGNTPNTYNNPIALENRTPTTAGD